MEYFDSQTLRKVLYDPSIKRLYLDDDKKIIAKQICTAITFLHDSNPVILHKDIKSENILVNIHGQTKLCDFGLAKSEDVTGTALQTTEGELAKGTSLYLAPELLLNNCNASLESDIWSLGCVLLELFSGKSVWPLYVESLTVGVKEALSKLLLKK